MKVLVCWTHISGYMSACWRTLATNHGVDLRVMAWQTSGISRQAPFGNETVSGVSCRLLSPTERSDSGLILKLAEEADPDVIVIAGWMHGPYRRLLSSPRLRSCRFVVGMDSPWLGTVRQRLNRLRLYRFLGRVDRLVVAGERAFQYAVRLGVPESKIVRGVYAWDRDLFSRVADERQQRYAEWPRQFLFVGRYAEAKGIDVLVEAYAIYRGRVMEPWPLVCCGAGPMAYQLRREGIIDRGFIQPSALPDVFAEAGSFVLPSRYEPWGVVIAEAAATGLPVICTESCGASVEIVRSFTNGFVVPTGDVEALARGLVWVHENVDRLPAMGESARHHADAFGSDVWAVRWKAMLDQLVSPKLQP